MENIFSALADSNRRQVVELLHQKDSTLLELQENFSISFQALSKHIKVLEEAKIVSKQRKGKYRILSLNRDSMEPALKWITYYSNFWNQSFDKLELLIQKQQ
ncbi:ArsR/SmtB family transcription factor [Flagellimonas sp.]|uniref:ArsR/SmtB family transcription factor n=1 Tax=Flagellimonas sp. TaxID=2058762 RepID=UPI003B5BC215